MFDFIVISEYLVTSEMRTNAKINKKQILKLKMLVAIMAKFKNYL